MHSFSCMKYITLGAYYFNLLANITFAGFSFNESLLQQERSSEENVDAKRRKEAPDESCKEAEVKVCASICS